MGGWSKQVCRNIQRRDSVKKMLVTGGAGFIGSEFIRQQAGNDKIILIDKLTYAGDMRRLKNVEEQITFYRGDVADRKFMEHVFNKEKPKTVIHFAAESHVDRSILDSDPFTITNILGTQILLDMAIKTEVEKFIHISTDEVYGELGKDGIFKEGMPLKPNSPYSATKASAELLVRAYYRTHKLPSIIIRPSNNYGPYHYPEKFIPLIISNLLEGKPIPVYGKGEQIRDWLYTGDCCRGINTILRKGKPGEIYNLGGKSEYTNLDVAGKIINLLGKDETYIKFVHDRPGHDFRYALDNSKAEELGWKLSVSFEEGLKRTVEWYKENQWWWKPIKSKLKRESKGFWT